MSRRPRPIRVREPNVCSVQLSGRSWTPTRSVMTISSSHRSASARSFATVAPGVRILGVDALGDEYQPHQRPAFHRFGPSQRRIDQRSNAGGVLGGRRVPLLVPLKRGVPKPLGERTIGEHPHQRSGKLVDVAWLDEEHFAVVPSHVRDPADATRDDPPSARHRLDQDAPEPFRTRRQHEHRRAIHLGGDALRQELLDVLDLLGSSATSSSTTSRRLPSPRITRSASGSSRTTCRQAAVRPSMFLSASSIPTKSTVGRSGSGSAASRRRSTGPYRPRRMPSAGFPHFFNQTLGVARERTDSVGSAQRRAPYGVGERREETARRRPVQPCRRAPVAVHLDHDLGSAPARERTADKGGRRGERALRDDRLGSEVDDLPANMEGQAKIEEHAVEFADPALVEQAKPVVAGRALRDA